MPVASSAEAVHWHDAAERVDRPVVRVVDDPDGPLDRLVGTAEAADTLNTGFHAVYRRPGQYAGEPTARRATVQFFRADGCPLTDAVRVHSARELADVAGAVLVRDDVSAPPSPHLTLQCPVTTR